MKRWAVVVLVVLITAGALWDPTLAQPLGIHGDFTVDPGKRIGIVSLGWTMRETETLLGPFSWEMPRSWHWQVAGRLFWWQSHAVMMAFCGDKLFVAVSFYVADTVPEASWLNARLGRMRTPEGMGLSSRIENFDRVYGSPIGTVDGVVLTLTESNRPLRVYADGLFIVINPSRPVPTGIGVLDTGLCRGKSTYTGPYIPFLGRGVQAKSVFFSQTGDEAKGVIGTPIKVVDGSTPSFGLGDPIYAGVDLISPKATIGREATFGRQWMCNEGPKSLWRFKRTIQQGEGEEGVARLVGGINMRDRQPGKCRIEFLAGNVVIAGADFELR